MAKRPAKKRATKRSPEVIARMVKKCRETKQRSAKLWRETNVMHLRLQAEAARRQRYQGRTDVGVVEARHTVHGYKVLCAYSLHGRKIAELPVISTRNRESEVRRILLDVLSSADWGPEDGRPTRRSEAIARRNPADIDVLIAQSSKVPAPERRPARAYQAPAGLDAIFDKISRQGIESLTPDEREVLEAESRRLRDAA